MNTVVIWKKPDRDKGGIYYKKRCGDRLNFKTINHDSRTLPKEAPNTEFHKLKKQSKLGLGGLIIYLYKQALNRLFLV